MQKNAQPSKTAPTEEAERRLATLIRDHHSVLMAYAVRLTAGDRSWAEDVVQEAFIRAWRHIERMTDQYGSVRTWLMRVTHNLVMDGHRARRARPVEVEETEQVLAPIPDASDQVLASIVVEDALAVLTSGQRAVLVETYLRDRTMAQAAQALDLPIGTVKSRVFYALRELRAALTTQSAQRPTNAGAMRAPRTSPASCRSPHIARTVGSDAHRRSSGLPARRRPDQRAVCTSAR